jgi:MFS family permease
VSSYFWGFFADTRGRRYVILLALSISTSVTIISAFLRTFELFVICKFISGIL